VTKAGAAVLARLENARGVPLYPREVAQSTGLTDAEVAVALDQLWAAGAVQPATWRVARRDGKAKVGSRR